VAPSILLADDSPTVRGIMRVELEAAGFKVIEAADGEQALRLALADPPDVVLLDVEMPVMDGYACLQALKADEATANIPVVFVTGLLTAEDVARALKLGGHDYLRKPPESAELLARVNAALRVKQLQDELVARAEQLEHVSRTDYLTTLHNRRHMEEHLRMLTSAAKRHGFPLGVLLVDVDHFKQINDEHGHQVGDEVLVHVAQRLRDTTRTEDALGRWGGEEFLVLLPHTGVEEARALGERLRAAVCGAPIVTPAGDVTVTVSIGGAVAVATGGEELLRLADDRLYAAKAAGRDQVLIGASGDPTAG
jgi:two-component system cell cycle response regulator